MATKVIAPDRTVQVTSGGLMTNRFATWSEQVSYRINNAIVEGSGSPEGAVNAPRLTFYFDNVANTLYIKKSQLGSSTGWVAL